MALTEAQCTAQAQETKAIKEILTDASMELEVIFNFCDANQVCLLIGKHVPVQACSYVL